MILIFLEGIRDRTGCKVRVDTCLSLHVLSIANEYDAVAFTLAFLERKMRATDCYIHLAGEFEEFSSWCTGRIIWKKDVLLVFVMTPTL